MAGDVYGVVRETAERVASWPLLGVAVLFLWVLLTRRPERRVALLMGGIVLAMFGGWLQRTVFATREWACRSVGPECLAVTGDHILSVVALYLIFVGSLCHYVTLINAKGALRKAAWITMFAMLLLALFHGLSDPIYAVLWPFVRSLAGFP